MADGDDDDVEEEAGARSEKEEEQGKNSKGETAEVRIGGRGAEASHRTHTILIFEGSNRLEGCLRSRGKARAFPKEVEETEAVDDPLDRVSSVADFFGGK